MQISVESSPSDEAVRALSRGIVDFNCKAIPDLEPNDAELKFHVIARDDNGVVKGGLRASCYWNTLHIELLWLSETTRGGGAGRRIIQSAENHAIESGCELALVETTSWQAKPFYEKNGYTLMATLPGRPRGHASHYLSKTLGASRS